MAELKRTEPRELAICKNRALNLPEESIVGKIGIVGMSGSGKTQTARKLAESMLQIQQHIAVLDPTGAWWGLRSSADGLNPGYPIVVFGGSHSDAPLKVDSGAMLGAALIKERFNAIFDMSKFSEAEIRRFSTDFLNEVYVRNRHPLHLFMDEFDIICPQAKGANSEVARAAVNTVVRRGRIRGIGSTMITQNPQDADKSVLNMADIVIAMRTQGSQAIDAIGKWMGRNLSKVQLVDLVGKLPSLKTGVGFVWAPQLNAFSIVDFLLCKTFDSGKTPKMGETIRPPKVLAQVDIEKLGQKIAQQVEEAKENDSAYLKEKIRQLEAKGGIPVGMIEEIHAMENELQELRASGGKVLLLERNIELLQSRHTQFIERLTSVMTEFGVEVHLHETPALHVSEVRRLLPPGRVPKVEEAVFTPSTPVDRANDTSKGINIRQRILRTLAEFEAIGRKSIARNILSAWAEARGGYFNDTIGRMKTVGLIDYPQGGMVALTDEGRKEAPPVYRPPNAAAFFDTVVRQAGGGLNERIMLRLRRDFPSGLSREELSGEVAASGGYFNDTVGRLKSAGFIEYPTKGQVRLQPWTVMQ